MITFSDLNLIEPLQRAVAAQNYTHPTPIQAEAIPSLLEGRDVFGCAQTGTGKTAAFALPVLQHIAKAKRPRGKAVIKALVLSPTRELAAQIGENFEAYSEYLPIRSLVIFGGVKEKPQIAALERGLDVLVATPGRLLDLMGRGFIDLSQVEFFVLDEADRMLDMGFIHDIRRVLKVLPEDRQNLLFSATMPPDIVRLASDFMDDPVQVEVTPEASTVEVIDQRVMFVERADKRRLLAHLILNLDIDRAIVFTRTKRGANRLCKVLERDDIHAAPIHGNKSQNARTRALEGFKSGDITVLVATDIASRGIDVDDVTHVFNFDLPNEPEVYVHRIGRTGRAGRDGVAIAFCDPTEGDYLRDIERLIDEDIPVDTDHPYHSEDAVPPPRKRHQRRRASSNSRNSRSRTRSQGRRDQPRRSPGARRNDNPDAQQDNAGQEASTGQAQASAPPQSAEGEANNGQRRRRRRRRRRRPAPGVPVESSESAGRDDSKAPRPANTSASSDNAQRPQGQRPQATGGDNPNQGQKRRRRRRRRRRPSGGQGEQTSSTT